MDACFVIHAECLELKVVSLVVNLNQLSLKKALGIGSMPLGRTVSLLVMLDTLATIRHRLQGASTN